MPENRTYICIDLKSFYASVECVERGLDPLTTNLVVADRSRTNKTICLAVSPSLKSYGIGGRARLFEVEQAVERVNLKRLKDNKNQPFSGRSYDNTEVLDKPYLKLDYIVATPRMRFYMDYSGKSYSIYLKYVSSEDIHVYSIDEVFIDVTSYLTLYKTDGHGFAMMLIRDVLSQTGITATAGVGTNMFLAKIAMDIEAKKMKADKDGVRVAELDEMSYRRQLWSHKPITDFWRVGKGIARRLEKYGLYTMGDVARYSINNEDVLYKEFGINAELLIDHAWGWEPARIEDIKAYTPQAKSISSGQVLSRPYDYKQALIIVKEMADSLGLDLIRKGYLTNSVGLYLNYDSNYDEYDGNMETDYYGRTVPKAAKGTARLKDYTASSHVIMKSLVEVYNRIINKSLKIRKITISANNLINEENFENTRSYRQFDLFSDIEEIENQEKKEEEDIARERKVQKTINEIRDRYGKNAVLKGMSKEEGATAIERNMQIGGHKG